jgi:glycosyltransferase involved in cell wall biosynthesis
MPRLLSINNYHYRRGGAEAVYLDQQALFAAAGWETAEFAMQHPRNIESRFSRYFVEEIEFGRDYCLLQKLRMAAKIIHSPEARRKMGMLLDDFDADVAHVHSVYHHISPSVLPVLSERGVPVVLTAHDLKLLCPAYTMLRDGRPCEECAGSSTIHAFRHRCIKGSGMLSALIALESGIHRLQGVYRKHVDRLVAPSKFYRDKFVEYGWPEEQVSYVPNFLVAENFEPRYEPGDYFVFVGRLSYEKGVDTLVRAAAAANAPLRVVGDGPLRQSLQDQYGGKHASIHFEGFQSGDDLWNLIRGSRALVIPSEWYENAPISVLEAYAAGKPVIGAEIGGIPELIETGETGWLFESGSAEGLAELLGEVMAMPSGDIQEMGRVARNRVESRHSPATYRSNLQAVYESIGVEADTTADKVIHQGAGAAP